MRIAWLMALGTLSGCFTAHNAEVTSEYARQVSTATLRVAQVEQELVVSQDRILQLEESIRLRGQSEAERLENIDQVNTEVARLRGQIEVISFQQSEIDSSSGDQQISWERRALHAESRMRQLESFLGVSPPPPPTDAELGLTVGADGAVIGEGDGGTSTDESPAVQQPTETLPDDASGKLDIAAGHMEAGREGVARAILNRAIADHVGAPEMAEIRYRYGETFFNEQKWREAILEFQKVIDNHAKDDFACWSYYRQGEAMEQFSGLQQATAFFRGATTGACKNSEASKLAKKKL